MNPDQLRKMAADLDEQGKALLEKRKPADAAEKFALAEVYETAAKEMERIAAAKRLPGGAAPRTIRNMSLDTRDFDADVKRGVGRATRKHPAQMKLYAKGVTISALAKELRETRARVTSWMNTGKDVRAIPRHHAEYLRERYGIPLSAWARIQD